MNWKKVFGSLFVAAAVMGTSVFAQSEAAVEEEVTNPWRPSFSLSAEYASRYLSKGKVCTPESMTFYDASISLQGFTLGIWIANDHNDYNEGDKMQYEPEEIDYYIGYDYTFDEVPVFNSLDVSLYYTYYDYPKRSGWWHDQTDEYSLSVTAGLFLNPGFQICWDPEHELWYGNINIGYEYTFKEEGAEWLTFETGLEAWWGNNRFLGNDKHDNDLAWTTICWNNSLNFSVCDNVTISPFATLAWSIDPAYRQSWKYNDNAKSGCNTLWGVKVSFEF